MTVAGHFIYSLLWLSFGVAHSVLASNQIKQRFESVTGGSYRLIYNVISVAHIAVVWLAGQFWLGTSVGPFDWPEAVQLTRLCVQLLGLVILIAALAHYDLGRFAGLTQLRQSTAGSAGLPTEKLSVKGLHRYVRHPLYLGAYLILVGGIGDELSLATAMWGSLYLLVGTWFEERKLVRQYGDAYVNYVDAVPAIIPWKGRAI